MELGPHAQRLQAAVRRLEGPDPQYDTGRVIQLLGAWLSHELATLAIETRRLEVDYGVERDLAETYAADSPLAMLALNMAEAILTCD